MDTSTHLSPTIPMGVLPGGMTAAPRMPSGREVVGSGTMLGNYVLGRCLGEGGMGTVYAACHRFLNRPAAVKVLHDDLIDTNARARVIQEGWVIDQIDHPNVVKIYDCGVLEDGRPYLAMELLRGRSLAQLLAEGEVGWRDAIEILRQTCAGLAAAHACGVVHRDLKPANVFVSHRDGALEVKLVDWGIARVQATPWISARLTHSGWVVGTPQYMAPEQACGMEVDGRADIYALGVLAYQMFLGAVPVTGRSPVELAANHVHAAPVAPRFYWPEIPRVLERLILRMLAKRREDRPTLDDIAAGLDRVAAVLTEREQRTLAPERRRKAVALLVVAGLFFGASALVGWRHAAGAAERAAAAFQSG